MRKNKSFQYVKNYVQLGIIRGGREKQYLTSSKTFLSFFGLL